jgi:hypothetical protein
VWFLPVLDQIEFNEPVLAETDAILLKSSFMNVKPHRTTQLASTHALHARHHVSICSAEGSNDQTGGIWWWVRSHVE